MKKSDEILNLFLEKNKENISNTILNVVKKDYDKLLNKSSDVL
jgi:hypothetical protein